MIEARTQRILVVEDDPEIRYLLTVVLDADDREVVVVDSAQDALAQIAIEGPDLVVLDLILPDMDGRTLLAKLRDHTATSTVPVVVISGRGGQEIRQDCYELGADHFVEKPFDPAEIVAEVGRRLERWASQETSGHEEPVTGLLSRAGLAAEMPPDDTGYALALLQLDGFTQLTESWGWEDGERVLREVAAIVRAATHGVGPAAALGGGEFAVIVPETALVDPADVVGALVGRVRDLALLGPDGESVRITASAGLAAAEPGAELAETFEAVRRRLFHAREEGGNQLVAEEPTEDRGAKRVLVAEDDEISATILTHRLRKEGLEVVRFANGRAAYEAALEDTPDLVILDVKMPGMDGFEVLERLRRTPSYGPVPIVLLTSMGSEADVVRGFQLGADDYILKPFSPVELSARVWRLIRRGRSAPAG